MCGIAGFVIPAATPGPQALLDAMGQAIAHRGPDGSGALLLPTADARYTIGFLHRRLSIIDLATGDQPMANADGTVQLIFNGEIYNFQALREQLIGLGHTFATRSDTETIIHAYAQWGDECVHHLRGMFAFVLWDAPRQRLFMARDRFGKKPMFLCQAGGALLFGSEIKALLTYPGVPRAVDTTAVWDYFAYRYVPGPATLFDGIRKLMPGCTAVWENGTFTERRYFTPADSKPRVERPEPADPVDAFLATLDRKSVV